MRKMIQSWFGIGSKKEEEPTALKLLKDLMQIQKDSVDPIAMSDFNGKIGDDLYFEHKDIHFVDKVKLHTIRYVSKDGYGYHKWRINEKEYIQVYRKSTLWGQFLDSELTPMLTYLTEIKEEPLYQYMIEQRYPQIHLVSTSIQEIYELEGYVPNEVATKCVLLLRNVFTEIRELKETYKEEIIQKLDEEIKFMENNQLRIEQIKSQKKEQIIS